LAKKKKKKIVSAITPSITMQNEYQRALMQLGRAMAQKVRKNLLPMLKAQQGQYAPDTSLLYAADGISDDISSFFDEFHQTFTGTIGTGWGRQTAENMVNGLENLNAKKFNDNIERVTGVNLGEVLQVEGLEDFKNTMINKNASLIKTLPEQYISQVETIVSNGTTSGARYSEIVKQIVSETGANAKLVGRIKTIARNEISTITAQLTKKRSEQLGIKKAIYQTSKDKNVRTSHKKLDRVEFKLAVGAWSQIAKKYIIPGITDINCRCTYKPIIELD
jgi:SPP1 gp7 family putative phage head morphogenesis protein